MGMDYDMSPDEDELEDLSESEDDALDGLPDPRVMEVDSDEEEAPKLVKASKKNKNKRAAESDDEGATLDELISKTKAEAPATNGEQKLSKKQAKKLKNNEGQAVPAAQESAKKQTKEKAEAPGSDKKKVQFAKNLELGPTGSPKVEETKAKPANNPRTVQGVTVDDKKEGKGRPAKSGDKIEMRYIGKLANGKQFDGKRLLANYSLHAANMVIANKKGKPFSFKLGVGEVIKGWDVGVVGMKAGGERRLTIPSKLAYGSKAIPGIPANSELIFDIKCISVN
jgi:FK506-binding nuclear protein